MKALVTPILCAYLCGTAAADDGLVLQQGAELESAHSIENATAAGLTAGLLGFESVEAFRWAYASKPGGGYGDLSELDKVLGYGYGTLAAAGSIGMTILAIRDLVDTPVADARDAYRAGDHTASWRLGDRELSKRQRDKRTLAWVALVADTGLAAYGLAELGNEKRHDLGVAKLWIGGTGMLLSTTVLLHTREAAETRTHRQLGMSVSPGGIALAGRF